MQTYLMSNENVKNNGGYKASKGHNFYTRYF